jgi:type II secretory pathway component GspD/PulD (secretin)
MVLRIKLLLFVCAVAILVGVPAKMMAQDTVPAISLKDARLDDVIRMLAERAQINLVLTKEMSQKVTIQLKENIPPLKLLETVVIANGYILIRKENIYTVEDAKKKSDDMGGDQKKETTLEDQLGISSKQTGEGEEKPQNLFQLKRTPVEQVEAKIRELLSPMGKLEVNREANAVYVTDAPENVKKVKDFVDFLNLDPADSFAARVQQRTFKINRLTPENVEENIRNMLTPDKGKSVLDKTSMTLVVTDREEVLNKIAQFLSAADQPEPQVYIRCHVVEVILDADTQTGFEFGEDFSFKAGEYFTGSMGYNRLPTDSNAGISLTNPDGSSFEFRAAANRNNARLLSSPNLLCYNKMSSKIQVIKEIPSVTSTLDTDTGNLTYTVEFKEAGITLEVTPDIYSDGTVKMNLKAEVSEQVATVSKGAAGEETIDIPVIKRKKVESNVMARDKQTVVIGGILEDAIRKERYKVPLLADIPLLGLLFSREIQSMQKTELLIFMNITIVGEKYLKTMAKEEWKAQQEKFDKLDTEFEFYPHIKDKLDMDKLNPDYDKK